MGFEYCPPVELPDLKSVTMPDGKRFYTTPSGLQVPSVTTVLGHQKRKAIAEWRARVGEEEANKISKKASSRGTNVHKICENYLNNQLDYYRGVMPDSLEMFNSIKPYLDKISKIHYQEQSLWSEMLGLAGRCDCIAHYEGELASIDFKTSRKAKLKEDIVDYFQQTTAYALMHEELTGIPINKLVIIMAVEDSEPLVFVEETANYIESLVKVIDDYKRYIV